MLNQKAERQQRVKWTEASVRDLKPKNFRYYKSLFSRFKALNSKIVYIRFKLIVHILKKLFFLFFLSIIILN